MGLFWFLKKRKALKTAENLEKEDGFFGNLKKEENEFSKEEKQLHRMIKHKKKP